ncbi:ParA family protein [Halostella sp. JP-L12]|uniref:ParA family protein n=1 Tax=Halostella TaxID=1843185 RepID=UPI000EF77EAE|nr:MULTISPECIES: ParA family protein [Halostella]NHN46294.1 ParA family protein [Halostella sp. JP-L12]
MPTDTATLVGATGGAGTTRLSIEVAATLARDGRNVAVVDAAYDTQGLSHYVDGRIDPDVTTLVTDETASVGDALIDLDYGGPGRLAICPARAAFEALARAKTAVAAERLGDELRTAADAVDHVVVDAPPVADNPAVTAVTAADRVGAVIPATHRGVDALQRLRGRLADVGSSADLVVANRGEDPVGTADVSVPESEVTRPANAPACADPDPEFAPAVASLAEALFEVSLDLEFPEEKFLSL